MSLSREGASFLLLLAISVVEMIVVVIIPVLWSLLLGKNKPPHIRSLWNDAAFPDWTRLDYFKQLIDAKFFQPL
jgi:hypothetical protein